MRSHLALALAFALAVLCVGDVLALYEDNYRTTNVSVSGLTQHLIYRNIADSDRLYIKDAGPISTLPAASIRPAAAVIGSNINVFYVDAATNDIRRIIVTDPTVPTVFTDEVFLTVADDLIDPPLALAIDEQGVELAVSVASAVAEIRRWNIADGSVLTPIIPVGPVVGIGLQVCYKSFNSIAYDFPSAYDLTSNPILLTSYSPSLLVYGADSCIDTTTIDCACAADLDSYNSVGVVDLATVDTALEVSYPFASQGNNMVSYFFPVFNPFDNKEIAADEVTGTGSRVVVTTVGSGLTEVVVNPPFSLGMPSWSLDGATDFIVTDDDGTNSNLVSVTDSTPALDPAVADADLPVQVLDGLRPFFASFVTNPSPIDYGVVAQDDTKEIDVVFLNDGNLGFEITAIAAQPGSVFDFEWFAPLPMVMEPGQARNVTFSITPTSGGGAVSEDYIVTTNWGDHHLLFNIDTGDGAGDPGGIGGGELGVPHDEGEFIGPCFITQALK